MNAIDMNALLAQRLKNEQENRNNNKMVRVEEAPVDDEREKLRRALTLQAQSMCARREQPTQASQNQNQNQKEEVSGLRRALLLQAQSLQARTVPLMEEVTEEEDVVVDEKDKLRQALLLQAMFAMNQQPQQSQQQHQQQSPKSTHWALVLDTNVYIKEKVMIHKLFNLDRFTVIVPIPVLTELDGLKNNNKEPEVKKAAIHWNIYFDKRTKEAANGAPVTHLRFQSSQEFKCAEPLYPAEKKDDSIISCAEYFSAHRELVVKNTISKHAQQPSTTSSSSESEKPVPNKVVLITEDRNMKSLARMRQVEVISTRAFVRQFSHLAL